MPKETFINPELAIIKKIQSQIPSMEKYFRKLTNDQSIKIIFKIDENTLIISSEDFSEESLAILKLEIEPFHTKLDKKTNETRTVGKSEFTEKQIITKFNSKTRLLSVCEKFYSKFRETADYSTIFKDFGFIYYTDKNNKLRLVNIIENSIIEIKNARIKRYLENNKLISVKKSPSKITELTAKTEDIKKQAIKYASTQFEDESDEEFNKRLSQDPTFVQLARQMQQTFTTLYQDARVGSYDHYEQLQKDKRFYFHQDLVKADEVYAKAHALHEEIHKLSDLTPEVEKSKQEKSKQKVVSAALTFESLPEILSQLNFTAQVEFIKNLSIRYCEVLENLISEISPSSRDNIILEICSNNLKAINVFKTNSELSPIEKLDQLTIFLHNFISSLEKTIPEKPKSVIATKSFQESGSQNTGSFSRLGLFSVKKTNTPAPSLPSVDESAETFASEIFMLEILKKIKLSIENLIKEKPSHEILSELNFTAQAESMENLSIRYCEVLENLINETIPSIGDNELRKICATTVEAIGALKTDPALSSIEKLDQLQRFLGEVASVLESIKPTNNIATKPSLGLPLPDEEPKKTLVEMLKRTKLSIENLIKKEFADSITENKSLDFHL